VANAPDWSDAVFDPPWPPGTAVLDERTGEVYHVSPPDAELQQQIDQQVDRVAAADRPAERRSGTEPATSLPTEAASNSVFLPTDAQGAPPRPPAQIIDLPRQTTATSRASGRVGRPLHTRPAASLPRPTTGAATRGPDQPVRPASWRWVALPFAAGLGLALAWILRRRGNSLRLGILLALAVVPAWASVSQAQTSRVDVNLDPVLGDQRAMNCALNAAVFVCRYFGASCELDSIAAALEIGPWRERAGSLAAIKHALETRELRVQGGFSNAAGGRVILNNGTARFADGLANAGQLQVTFGGGSVFGAVSTTQGGKIILSGNSNTTFYDPVEIQTGGDRKSVV